MSTTHNHLPPVYIPHLYLKLPLGAIINYSMASKFTLVQTKKIRDIIKNISTISTFRESHESKQNPGRSFVLIDLFSECVPSPTLFMLPQVIELIKQVPQPSKAYIRNVTMMSIYRLNHFLNEVNKLRQASRYRNNVLKYVIQEETSTLKVKVEDKTGESKQEVLKKSVSENALLVRSNLESDLNHIIRNNTPQPDSMTRLVKQLLRLRRSEISISQEVRSDASPRLDHKLLNKNAKIRLARGSRSQTHKAYHAEIMSGCRILNTVKLILRYNIQKSRTIQNNLLANPMGRGLIKIPAYLRLRSISECIPKHDLDLLFFVRTSKIKNIQSSRCSFLGFKHTEIQGRGISIGQVDTHQFRYIKDAFYRPDSEKGCYRIEVDYTGGFSDGLKEGLGSAVYYINTWPKHTDPSSGHRKLMCEYQGGFRQSYFHGFGTKRIYATDGRTLRAICTGEWENNVLKDMQRFCLFDTDGRKLIDLNHNNKYLKFNYVFSRLKDHKGCLSLKKFIRINDSLIWVDFCGSCRDGKPHGYIKIDLDVDNCGFSYSGHCLNGEPYGRGHHVIKDVSYEFDEYTDRYKKHEHINDIYRGEWKNGCLDGVGDHDCFCKRSFMRKNNIVSSYHGDFSKGSKNGSGRFHTYGTVRSYEGKFKNDMFHGRGKLTTAKGVFEGDFLNGKLNKGEAYGHLANGISRYYTGGLLDEKFAGNGRLTVRTPHPNDDSSETTFVSHEVVARYPITDNRGRSQEPIEGTIKKLRFDGTTESHFEGTIIGNIMCFPDEGTMVFYQADGIKRKKVFKGAFRKLYGKPKGYGIPDNGETTWYDEDGETVLKTYLGSYYNGKPSRECSIVFYEGGVPVEQKQQNTGLGDSW